jgi:hypothetical protein
MNQSLIEFKITVKDLIVNLISNPTTPGNPPASGPINPGVISPSISESSNSFGQSTVTPMPSSSSKLLPIIDNSADSAVWADESTQTVLDGVVLQSMINFCNHHLNNTVEQGVQTDVIFREL